MVTSQLQFIQAIRGMAALLVVYFHTLHPPVFGEFGVDIFFVLSGFIMAMLMERESSAAAFFGRRLVRIVPLYFFLTTLAAVLSWTFPQLRKSGGVPELHHYILSLLFVPNRTITGDLSPVLSFGWTLNYEMMFYLLCAVSLTFFPRFRIGATAVMLGLILVAGRLADPAGVFGEFAGNPIILEFLAGMLLWKVAARLGWQGASLLALPVVILLVVSLALFHAQGGWAPASAGAWARPLNYLLPASFLIFVAYTHEAAFRQLWLPLRSVLVRLGDASYAIYLTQVFTLGLLSLFFTKTGLSSLSSPIGMAIAVLLSALAGVVTHEKFDSWMQKRLRSWLPL